MSEPDSDTLKRDSNDVGWEYGTLFKKDNLDKWKCKLCAKEFSGGVYRIKLHIANIRGQITPCTKSTDEDKAKCETALDEVKNKKNKKDKQQQEVHITDDADEEVVSRKRPHTLGPVDKFESVIYPKSSIDSNKNLRQQNIHYALWKERTHDVHRFLSRWVYENGIPFHATDNDSFRRFVEAVGQFGPGYQPPSQYQLKKSLLVQDSVLEPRRSAGDVEVRELHKENFVSNEDTEDEGEQDYEFESDGEILLERYGDEELEK